ncbi:MAG: hypothetical protein ACKO7R_14455 [Pseudanabaena sp.]
MQTIIHPLHYLIVEKKETTWYFGFSESDVFYNRLNCPTPKTVDDLFFQFSLTASKVVTELFRLHCGRSGYYLANLRDKKYYYCGLLWRDVQETLLDLGIGRREVER